MEPILEGTLKIGISACLYDCKFRYNGKGWNQVNFIGREKGEFTWYPVCVEVAAGFGVPREAIRITGGNGDQVWKGEASVKTSSGKDVSQTLMNSCDFAVDMLKREGVHAFIYMEGSPSCGVYRTTLKNKRLGKPPGVFGAKLLEEGFFLIPGQDLSSPVKWWDWRRRLMAFLWLKEQPLDSRKELFAVWHTIKFLCQELDESYSRAIGKAIAALGNGGDLDPLKSVNEAGEVVYIDEPALYKKWQVEWLMLLRQPSTIEKIKNRLWKHYSFTKKKTGVVIDDVMAPDGLRNVTHLAKELLLMERASRDSRYLFGASPILKKHSNKR